MEFATRDRYRHVVEKIAKYSEHFESDVARKAIELPQEAAAAKGGEDRAAHVGYYLIGEGVRAAGKCRGGAPSRRERMGQSCRRVPVLLYVGGIVLITLAPGRTPGGQGLRQRGRILAAGR